MMTSPNLNLQIKQILLHKLRVSNSIAIPAHLLKNLDIVVYTDRCNDETIVALTSYLSCAKWTTQKGTKRSIEYPTTWLDAFKLRWFPKILLAHWPINYTTVQVSPSVTNNYWIFPEIPPNPDPRITEFLVAYAAKRS